MEENSLESASGESRVAGLGMAKWGEASRQKGNCKMGFGNCQLLAGIDEWGVASSESPVASNDLPVTRHQGQHDRRE